MILLNNMYRTKTRFTWHDQSNKISTGIMYREVGVGRSGDPLQGTLETTDLFFFSEEYIYRCSFRCSVYLCHCVYLNIFFVILVHSYIITFVYLVAVNEISHQYITSIFYSPLSIIDQMRQQHSLDAFHTI